MKTRILEHMQTLRKDSGFSLTTLHEKTSFATTTLHRWFSGESSPDIYELTTLVEAMGGSMTDLFADVGKQEMQSTQAIEYQGAVAMQEHYATRLAAAKDKLDMLQTHHEQAIKTQQDTYDRSVQYLKEQVREMKYERANLQERVSVLNKRNEDLDRRRHNVFWGMLAALLLSSGGLVACLCVMLMG